MNLPFFIARKYFLSKKKKNFINVISIISMLVVGISTMALIIVLSVFNGLEDLLRNTYSTFDPQIVIMPSKGKSFVFDTDLKEKIEKTEGVSSITEVIEMKALIRYKNAERVVTLKGVSENFLQEKRLDNSIVYGNAKLKEGEINYAIVGRGVQYDLSINPNNDFYSMQVYYPRNIDPGAVNPSRMVKIQYIIPSAIFAIEKYYDENYVFVPLEFTRDLSDYGEKRSSLEVSLDPDVGLVEARERIVSSLGTDYTIKLSEELHEDLYKILRIEKLFVFVIFSLIIGIASINIYFSLTMLAIDKKKDMMILTSMGASTNLVRNIFLAEGGIVALSGAMVGMFLGIAISYIQQEFGIVSMGMQTTIMDAYPVKIEPGDVLSTALCIIVITILASIAPSRLAIKKISIQDL